MKEIPDRPQRQDSTERQLRDLRAVANKLGMYDAEKAIRNQFFKEELPNR